MWSVIKDVLIYLGFTPEKITPLLVLAILCIWLISKRAKPIEVMIRKITNAVIEIQSIFNHSYGIKMDHKLTEASGSPLMPTPYSVKIFKESGLEKVLNENKESFVRELTKQLPRDYTDYDVQEIARTFLLEKFTTPLMNEVKKYAYENAMDMTTYIRTAGLWLRDDFLGIERRIAKEKKD